MLLQQSDVFAEQADRKRRERVESVKSMTLEQLETELVNLKGQHA